jgi:hypothetical protein
MKALDDIKGVEFVAPGDVVFQNIGLASIKEIMKQYLYSLNTMS